MASGCVSATIAGASTAPSSVSLFGMIRWSRSISVIGTSSSTKTSAEPDVLVGA